MEQLVTQLGVGGILALLVIREVLNFLKNKQNEKQGCSVKRDEFEHHKSQVRYRDTCDERHEAIQRQFVDFKADLTEIKQLIRAKQ